MSLLTDFQPPAEEPTPPKTLKCGWIVIFEVRVKGEEPNGAYVGPYETKEEAEFVANNPKDETSFLVALLFKPYSAAVIGSDLAKKKNPRLVTMVAPLHTTANLAIAAGKVSGKLSK